MYRSTKTTLKACCLLILSYNLIGQNNDVRLYAFAHSLIDHRPPAIVTPSDETTVMYWIQDIVSQTSNSFAGGGQFGFLTQHVNLPPASILGYDNVTGVWDKDTETFAEANINTILLTAGNFIQYTPVDGPYPLDESTTVIEATSLIFDWVNQQEEGVAYFIYANWPEMDLQQAYPPTLPSATEVSDYHAQTIGSFSDWWIDYQDKMLLARPDLNTRLIPVGNLISRIITEVIPGQVPFDELYEDSAPHGRASLYFMAGMITYAAIYGEEIPAAYVPSDIVHVGIRSNLQAIKSFVWTELNNYNFQDGSSRVFSNQATTTPTDNVLLENNAIVLYPNPNLGTFEITGLLDNYTIVIIDTNGNIFQTIDNQSDSTVVDITDLPNNTYFIQIQNENNQTLWLERVVKIR